MIARESKPVPMNRSHVAPTACSNAYWRGVAAISAVALCWRSFWLLRPEWEIGDASEYLKLGQSIVHSGIYSYDGSHPSSYRPPLYPAFIAAADLFTGRPVETVLIAQVIIGALTVTLACLIAARAFDQPTAIIAGAMLAVAPMTSRYAPCCGLRRCSHSLSSRASRCGRGNTG
jgi:4-amino-4-deoxy-L-arabinose transferase-like glycosyltransferase